VALAQGPSHPLGADVAYLPDVPRWRPLINWALVIPHNIWLGLLTIGAFVVAFLGWFAIVFTGRMPETWSDYSVGVLRYHWRVNCYLFGWTDVYPSFTPVGGHVDPADYPAVLYCARPVERNRLSVALRVILAIPHYIALYLVGIAAFAVLVAAWFAVVITGRWPEGMRAFAVGFVRWQMRFTAYVLLVCDAYPPFSLES
jgi:hypothetical protein